MYFTMPTLYILAGPNGAGKTTASRYLLPEVFHTDIFINADIIAAQMNPDNPEAASIAAGRQMLLEIEENLSAKETFAIETTLSNKGYLQMVKRAQLIGYEVVLTFFYLPSVEVAMNRVALRVKKGGHNIPQEVIERRYKMGLIMLPEYCKIVNRWRIFNNQNNPPELIAEGEMEARIKILNFTLWKRLKQA
jgi:predicted ABC-type ATPase